MIQQLRVLMVGTISYMYFDLLMRTSEGIPVLPSAKGG